MKRYLLIAIAFQLFVIKSYAGIEFFFNTSPAALNHNVMRMIHSIPTSALGHGSLYISSACYNFSDHTIRMCDESDDEKGVVISFDTELQNRTKHYFMAVTVNEYFYGKLDRNNLPPKMTKEIIDKMDNYFFDKYSILKGQDVIKAELANLSNKYSIKKDILLSIVKELDQVHYTFKNFNNIFIKYELKNFTHLRKKKLYADLKYLDHRGLKYRGFARREVGYGNSFYEGLWSLVYPTSIEEEEMIIEYVNTLKYKKADLAKNNCVYPMTKIGKMLFGTNRTFPPYFKIPYFILNNLISNTIEKNINTKNQLGAYINRPGIFMKFYPMINIEFEKNIDKFPKRHFNNPELLGNYVKYQGENTNKLGLKIKSLKQKNKKKYKNEIKELKELKNSIYSMEVKINKINNEIIMYNKERNNDVLEEISSLKDQVQTFYERGEKVYNTIIEN